MSEESFKTTTPESELLELDQAITLNLTTLTRGYEENDEFKPWPATETLKAIDGILEFLKRKETILSAKKDMTNSEKARVQISSLEKISKELKLDQPVDVDLLERIKTSLD